MRGTSGKIQAEDQPRNLWGFLSLVCGELAAHIQDNTCLTGLVYRQSGMGCSSALEYLGTIMPSSAAIKNAATNFLALSIFHASFIIS